MDDIISELMSSTDDEWDILLQMGREFKTQNVTMTTLRLAYDKFHDYLYNFINNNTYNSPRMQAHMNILRQDILNYINLFNIHDILYADKEMELIELGYNITTRIYYTRIEVANGYDDYYPNDTNVDIKCYESPTFDLTDINDPEKIKYEQSIMLMGKLL